MSRIIRNSEINALLEGKLKDSDIKIASDQCTKSALKIENDINLLISERCKGCVDEVQLNKTIPVGNVFSSVMLIASYPSETDAKAKVPFFDEAGRFITVILDKLGLTRDNVYITSACKCSEDDEAKAILCSTRYLIREIEMVEPKKIITFGAYAANCIDFNYKNIETSLDEEEIKGRISTITINGEDVKVLNVIDPRNLLAKAGSLFNKYKLDMWNSISKFLKEG